MYRQSYQRGVFSIFYSVGSKPLALWDTVTRDGYITKFLDEDIKSTVLEIGGTNVSTTYMICPKGNAVLGICMPFLVMIVKNLRKYFSFEVTILDETGTRRRFRVSNFQSQTQILPLCTVMPIGLSEGWNQIQFNLAEFTRRAYKKQFIEVQKVKINANIRLRRIYFAERLIPEDQLPAEYKLFFPLKSLPGSFKQKGKGKDKVDEKDIKIDEVKEDDKEKSAAIDTVGTGAGEAEGPVAAAVASAGAGIGEGEKGETAEIEGELSKKSGSASKVRVSIQVIKTASQAPPYEDRSSQMFHVHEDPLDRVEASTMVPGLSEQLPQVGKEDSEHNLAPIALSTVASTKGSTEDDAKIMETILPEAAEDQAIVAQTEGVQSGVTVLTEITEVNEQVENELVEYTEVNEPVQYTDVSEPVENTDVSEPVENTEVSEPVENTEVSEPVENTEVSEPVEYTEEQPVVEQLN
ncbi:uncharacterized protein LOC118265861 [Spodoptera frugiperda]|uniref:Uncharacterized protein LOC118265861 n=1 Tax=Spodoptera frugiperda TaxID=7108 RepID=A0A9R0CZJ2_SPOFR|nr:uncharacterized protein LOC118265861 [Spodoptera frugiperda]